MRIVVVGSLGHIGEPLAKSLIEKGHEVTVISSKKSKVKQIEGIGAHAAIGSVDDEEFVLKTFEGKDAAYVMTPPPFIHVDDPVSNYKKLGHIYATAAAKSKGFTRIVNLSSIGADQSEGTGFLVGAYEMEQTLNKELKGTGISVIHLRPTSFYYNIYGQLDLIKTKGQMEANYGGEDRISLVAPIDIAQAAFEELTGKEREADKSPHIRYVASDERTYNDIAKVIGHEISIPDLKWVVVSDEDQLKTFLAWGFAKRPAELFVEMGASIHSGKLGNHYWKTKPEVTGKVKLEDFAKEFAQVWKRQYV